MYEDGSYQQPRRPSYVIGEAPVTEDEYRDF